MQRFITESILRISSLLLNGLHMKSSAPSENSSIAFFGDLFSVIAMMGKSKDNRIILHTSAPEKNGNAMSNSTISGLFSLIESIARSPLRQDETIYPFSSNKICIEENNSISSSTIST